MNEINGCFRKGRYRSLICNPFFAKTPFWQHQKQGTDHKNQDKQWYRSIPQIKESWIRKGTDQLICSPHFPILICTPFFIQKGGTDQGNGDNQGYRSPRAIKPDLAGKRKAHQRKQAKT